MLILGWSRPSRSLLQVSARDSLLISTWWDDSKDLVFLPELQQSDVLFFHKANPNIVMAWISRFGMLLNIPWASHQHLMRIRDTCCSDCSKEIIVWPSQTLSNFFQDIHDTSETLMDGPSIWDELQVKIWKIIFWQFWASSEFEQIPKSPESVPNHMFPT